MSYTNTLSQFATIDMFATKHDKFATREGLYQSMRFEGNS